MSYIISNTDKFSVENLYREDYTRQEIEPIMTTVNRFMIWINANGYSMEKWITK